MGYKIRKLRKEKKMTQQELADKSGVSRTIISFLESGTRTVSKTSTLIKIADALDVSLAELFSAD